MNRGIDCPKPLSSDRFPYKPQKPRQTAPSPSHWRCSCPKGYHASDFTSVALLPVAFSSLLFSCGALKWAVLRVPWTVACIKCGYLSFERARLLRIDEIAHTDLNAGSSQGTLSRKCKSQHCTPGSCVLSNVEWCCKIVAVLERCVYQCLQLSCPLHYARNNDGPWRSRRSRVSPDFFSRLGRIGLWSEPPASKKKCVTKDSFCIADSTAFQWNILEPLAAHNRQVVPEDQLDD